MGLMIVSLLLAVVVFILLKLKPEGDTDEDDDSVELEEIQERPPESNRLMNDENRKTDSVESMPESLLDMENVGDDHDSLDSASHLDETRERLNRSRILESNL